MSPAQVADDNIDKILGIKSTTHYAKDTNRFDVSRKEISYGISYSPIIQNFEAEKFISKT